MVYAEIRQDIIYDGIIIEIDEEDVNDICYDFDVFIEHLLETVDGRELQRIGDVVLFQVEGIERVYGICKDEYMRLIFHFHTELQAFTIKEYEHLMKAIAKFGNITTDYIC